MNDEIKHALETDLTIDITTTGRKSRVERKTEIWFHNIDGRLYITGLPGKRDWFANLAANPAFTFHLKQSAEADLPAIARVISDPQERRTVLTGIIAKLGGNRNIDEWAVSSPLVEVQLSDEG